MKDQAARSVQDASATDEPTKNAVEVQMIEIVTSEHTIDASSPNALMDIKPLLKLMDICTCAAAEKHTKVNCVTVSMGDVVFEYFPKCGDLLELTARPVYSTGRTSLDIHLGVVAEGEGGVRHMVCEAIFTYVTTRGPDGEKRLCPPLMTGGKEKMEWDMKIAQYRRNLLSVERRNSSSPSNIDSVPNGSGFDLEMSEVVLPLHQNHMGHTFGGVVMAWMAKAALTVAARQSKRSPSSLLVRSVLRVEFNCGSDVSDHLIFRPRLNAVFDGGRSAEVEVRVSKRSLSTGDETRMNVGYFYISGSAIGTWTDIPFGRKIFRRSSFNEQDRQKAWQDAEWRRRLLLARRQLLGGLGDGVEWHPSLQNEAPLLTLQSVLRLVHHRDYRSVSWREIPLDSRKTTTVTAREWTLGEAWGRSDTFVIRVKGLLPATSLAEALTTLRTKRKQWDFLCDGVEVLEEQQSKTNSLSSTADTKSSEPASIQWDIVRHRAITPTKALKTCEEVGVEADPIVPYCLLRTWQLDPLQQTAIFASQSVLHPKMGNDISVRVHPSGWFVNKAHDDTSHNSYLQLTYIAEHDFVGLRTVALGMSDESIVDVMADVVVTWFDRLKDAMATKE